MTTQSLSPSQEVLGPTPLRSWLALIAFAALFLAFRLPVILHQSGELDESYFAVPGLTILEDGIPRVPYMPSRDESSAFYKSDIVLFTLPPAYFYWQAAFYSVFGASYAAARIASSVAGLVAVWLVYWIGRRVFRDENTALLAAGLYSVSRVFFFPCLFARPDMLCGAIGIGAIACTWSWHHSGRIRVLVGAGALIGLGMLTHPSAIVYALQIGIWVLIGSPTWRGRIGNSVIVVGTSLAVFALWLPLILMHPDEFRVQFFNNVLDRSGPGLLQRLILPWEPLRYHSNLLLEHAGPWQLILVGFGLLIATVHDFPKRVRQKWSGHTLVVVLAWSSSYLLIACQGSHPTKGYWCYPGAFLFLCVGRAAMILFDQLCKLTSRTTLAAWCGSVLLALVMVPGSGLRATAAYITHWSDPDYDSRRFIRGVLKDMPPDARYVVDPAHVFEVYAEGRRTLTAQTTPFSFDVGGHPYDYLIASRYDLERDVPRELGAGFVRKYGDETDIFACYVEVYRSERE
ncbi:MAG: glycosyltransferase family 39 protein [Planctomycetota bacterium]|nr:glycosyltransferase family 39 protein [Planctomycetaceae bacterium]MDQ3330923.1 glycosyltransferase family 39 protein [Planctomycetota bacterium]